jgi:monoamine oxidase
MARSTLFHRIRRLMQRAAAANKPATPPTGPSRRDVLRTTLGAAAMLPLAPLVAACGDNTQLESGASVAIIGGGIAGLTCAHYLTLAGLTPTVFEASMRTGGRMYTIYDKLAGDQLCDLGGELIDSDHIVLPSLAATFGLQVDDLIAVTPGLEHDLFFFDGAPVDDATLVTEFTPVAAKMMDALNATDADDTEFARIDNLSIPDWLTQEAGLKTTDQIFRILCISYLEEFGLEVEMQSAFNLLTLIDSDVPPDDFEIFGVSDERYHMHRGSQSVPDAIAATIPDQIEIDHALTKVVANANDYTLTFSTSGGDVEVTVDHVVYALPFTKLREVDLTGAMLTADKMMVIQNLGYGTNAKLMLQFTDRPWETGAAMSDGGSITDVGELQTTWSTSRGQDGDQGIMTNFVGGDRGVAIGDMTAEDQAQMVLPWLATVFPSTGPTYIPNSAIRQHWPTYPFNKGSYASYLVGQWSFLGKEGARVGNQHFCGEHCSEDFQGYMEGGAETGAMNAGEILDDLGIPLPLTLAGLLKQVTARRPRASYHAGFGATMTVRQVRRHGRRRVQK